MRISDWSSDVCSSDLTCRARGCESREIDAGAAIAGRLAPHEDCRPVLSMTARHYSQEPESHEPAAAAADGSARHSTRSSWRLSSPLRRPPAPAWRPIARYLLSAFRLSSEEAPGGKEWVRTCSLR